MTGSQKKVALITGAGRGIGRGIAVALAKKRWFIGINDFGNPEPPEETLQLVKNEGGDGLVLISNIKEKEERTRMEGKLLDSYGQLDLLVNNAGISSPVRMDMLEIGEEGKLSGVFFGVLIMGILFNGLIQLNLSEFYQMIIKGAVLLIAVGFDSMSNARRQKLSDKAISLAKAAKQ